VYQQIARTLLLFGLLMILIGGGLLLFGKSPFLGKLPGDIHIQKKSFEFYFLIITCLVISIVLSALVSFYSLLFKK
jgi:hypothetical protein